MRAGDTGNDFPDWMSPMLVKELRQGMRSRVFMLAFFITQILMILSVSFSLSAAGTRGDTVRFFDGLFWALVGAPLLLVMPVRAFGGIGREIRACTLDLILLTRLSAWRVLVGKWCALVAQTLLLVCSILPYVVLRYFLGGVNLLDDLQTAFLLTLASAALTAVTLALSPYQSKILRGLFIIGFMFLIQASPFIIGMMAAGAVSSGPGSDPLFHWRLYAALILYFPAFILFALQSGAGRIAPPAENHAALKRLTGFVFLLAAPILIWLGIEPEISFAVTLFCLVPLAADSLTEDPPRVPAVYANFVRRGLWGRIAASFLLPGWPFALIYIVLIGIGVAGLARFVDGAIRPNDLILPALGATLLMPAALIRLVRPRTQHFLAFYIGLQIFFALITLFMNIIAEAGVGEMRGVLTLIPTSVFLMSTINIVRPEFVEMARNAMVFLLILSYLLLAVMAIGPLREIRRIWREYQTS